MSFHNFKKVFFFDNLIPLSPFSMLKYTKWTPPHGYNIEKGEGGQMWIVEIKKLTHSMKQVFLESFWRADLTI